MTFSFSDQEKIEILKARGYTIAKMPAIWEDLQYVEHKIEVLIAFTGKTWDEVKDLHYKSGIDKYSVDEIFSQELHKVVLNLLRTTPRI